jgi:protein-arginine kinase activator protein McsA
MFKCQQCKCNRAADWYGVNKRTGTRLVTCNQCRERYSKAPWRIKAKATWANSAGGRKYHNDYTRAWVKTEPGKALIARKKGTAATIANSRRQGQKRCEKLRNDPAARLAWNMRVRLRGMLSGQVRSSKTLFANSDFTSFAEVYEHFEKQLTGVMTMQNYGKVWHVDHRIPVDAYDHSDPEDVRRCWRKANLWPMLGPDNCSKSNKIVPWQCVLAGLECWPRKWAGRVQAAGTRLWVK